MGRSVKVLHVYRTYFPDPPGGLQEALRQICLSVQPFGVRSTIFTLSPNPIPAELVAEEARVVRARSWAAPASCDLGGPDAFIQFRRLAREADLIHYLYPWPFADLLRQFAPRSKPAVLTYVSDIVRQRWLRAAYAPLMWNTLRSMSVIVANAPAYRHSSKVLSDERVRDRVRLIPLGINSRTYRGAGDVRVLTRFGIVDEHPFVLFIGVLRYYKGLHHLVSAAAKVNAKIVVAGSGPDAASLRSKARMLSAGNVVFTGQVSVDEKIALLRHCRALVLPSHLRSEAYGMVLVEASMFGKPMISCEIGTGTSYVNVHEQTGFVVPPGDPEALADAINLLVSDSVLANEMGSAARMRYEQHFSGDALGRNYAQLFRETVGCERAS
jgi:glycosyltransferase involved in cell wall biosynthesis